MACARVMLVRSAVAARSACCQRRIWRGDVQPGQFRTQRQARVALVAAHGRGDLQQRVPNRQRLVVEPPRVRFRPARPMDRRRSVAVGKQSQVDLLRHVRQKRREELDRRQQDV